MTVGDWSPTLEQGIGYVRFDRPAGGTGGWEGRRVVLRDNSGADHAADVVALPFYDVEKRIPRGLEPLTGRADLPG